MNFEHLTDVHARWHAQRVQHDVARCAVSHVRHVFDGHDLGDHALVAVTAGHLVARLQAALDGQVDLDHLQHAGWQLVALCELFALFFKSQVKAVTRLLHRVLDALELAGHVITGRTNVKPVVLFDIRQIGLIDLGALGQLFRAAVGDLAVEQFLDTVKGVGFNNAQLVVQVQAEALELVVNDLLGTLVTHDAFTREDLHVDDSALRALAHAQRSVFHVAGFFAEDGAQQFFFRCQRGLAFGCDLADQRVARLDFSAHVDDAGLVEAVELQLGQVRNVARDVLGTELGVAGHDHEFFNVNRGVAVFSNHALGDQDRVFEVVAVPRHEGDQHVLTDGDLAQISRCAVGHHVTLGQLVADLNDRTLMDVGVLVRTLVLDEVVDVYAHFTCNRFGVVHAHHDAGGVHVVDHTAAVSRDHRAGVDRGNALDTRADQWLFRAQHRHSLTRHVGTHQRAVGVIVLEEWHEGGSDRDDLRRRNVHVLHALGAAQNRLAVFTRRHQLAGQLAVFVQQCIGLGNHVLAFFNGRQVVDLVSDLGVNDAAVRCLDETVFVQARIQGQRVDQADVRTFRRFNRADAAVVRDVNVAYFEAGALAGQTTGAKGRNTALVGDLGQRIGLVHELRQLRSAEELFESRGNRLGVDQVMRHERLLLGLAQTLFDSFLDASQTGAVLVLSEFTHATHAAIAQVIDVINLAIAVAQVHQDFHDCEDVLVGHDHRTGGFWTAHAGVELHAADLGQVVGVRVVEQALEQGLNCVFCRWLAGTHHAVDGDTGSELVGRFVSAQGL